MLFFCFTSVLAAAILGELRPYAERSSTIWSFVNEAFIFLMLYLLYGTTDVTASLDDRDIVGWCMIAVVIISLITCLARAAYMSFY